MRIAAFSIKHRVATTLACIIIVIFGVMAYFSLPLALYPNMEIPVAVVQTSYSGAGPEEIENLVTRPIESACASVSGMDTLQSTSSEGSSMVIIQFADGTDLDNALIDLRDKIDRVKGTLPDDASTPMVMSIDVDAMPVVTVGLKGADLPTLQSLADDTLAPSLERLDGVASVDVSGGYDNEVAINTYADKMAGYGLTVSYLTQILDAQNVSIPAGSVDSGSQSLSVRTDGEFTSVDEIANLMIPLPSGGSIHLSEVADVALAPQEQESIAKINGTPCIVLSVNKQSGVNTVQVAERAKTAMDALTADNPSLDWTLLSDQSDFINQSVASVTQNIVFGVLLSALVLFVFLRRVNATAILVISMPICIVSVFLIMQALDLTMNLMSLGGMGMGVGMIVDNSIVVLENIFRYRTDGKSRWDACVEGTGEVAMAITASSLTTIAVFLPISMTDGIVGMMFREFALTIVALITTSLIIALTLVPLLCYILLDRSDDSHLMASVDTTDLLQEKPLMRSYKRLLQFFLNKRRVAIFISFAMVIGFIFSIIVSVATKGVIMMPEMDQGAVAVSIEMPVGAELSETEAIADKVATIALEQIAETESVSFSTEASMYSDSSGVTVNVDLVEAKDRKRGSIEIANDLRNRLTDIAGAKMTTESSDNSGMSSMSGAALSVELRGDDYDVLTATASDLVQQLKQIPDAVDVSSSASDRVPSVNVTMNSMTASQFGLNAASVGAMVRAELAGQSATELRMSGDEITVTVKGDDASSKSLDALKSIPISTSSGGTIPLSLIANVEVTLTPQEINRVNQSRTITITGDSASGNTSALNQQAQAVLDAYTLPDGINYESGGEMEEIMDSLQSLGYALLVAMGLVYFILASQYESFILPVMVMVILPVGLLGAMFGLPITNNPISMTAVIGVIILAGTVVNSSIVLIDYIQTRRKQGEDKNTAIINACPRRVRPVLMTTMTTCLGLLPMALGLGSGSESMQPMAVVMISGMVISTIVTLLFTPVYYSLLDSLTERMARRKHRKHPAADADEAANA